ncbi:MAG: hypothetical protein VYA34_14870 [Myxococcota bacterium]|nr:hypothetical protein [Myxococcota bacterium]
MSNRVNIELSQDEALVFFDWIARFNGDKKHEVVHPAEERVLFDIESILEPKLTDILTDDYDQLLEKARESIPNQIVSRH